MKVRPVFVVAGMGLLIAVVSAIIYSRRPSAEPPVFAPASNPYGKGIYTNGIVESDQPQGQNINIYPEVSGTVTRIFVAEGQKVQQGSPLLSIEDSVQAAVAEQQRAQAEAAQTLLRELRAQPRPENLEVARAQVALAAANLKTADDSFNKQYAIFQKDPTLVSKDVIDADRNAVAVAQRNLEVAQRQYQLVRAGAWAYDIQSQEKQSEALQKAYGASKAQLEKYVLRAPADGVVLSIAAAVGSYVSSTQGTWDSYTQSSRPVVVMGSPQKFLAVRCYVDEILVNRLPPPDKIEAQMSIRGTDVQVSLQFVRVQPYVSPKIELSSQRQERVDVRVLPVIFRFERPASLEIYPGQLVDVYIGERGGTG
jgi:HlyD family secretion protein